MAIFITSFIVGGGAVRVDPMINGPYGWMPILPNMRASVGRRMV